MAPTKGQKGIPDMANAASLTPESFEEELKALAAKAKEQTPLKLFAEQVTPIVKAAILLTLAAASSNASQLTLSPVYGSIPSSIWHSQISMAACFIGWSSNLWLRRKLPRKPLALLGPLAVYIPTIQFLLFKFSRNMGPVVGPIVTELLTIFPLLLLSVSCTATLLEDLDLASLRIPKPIADAAPGIGSWAFFRTMVYHSRQFIDSSIGDSLLQTRIGIQLFLSVCYSSLAPSKLLRLAVPAILHTAIFNTHFQSPYTTSQLKNELQKSGWSLLDRQESLTGYISVLESQKDGYRVMRCDHSLLGGEWVKMPNGLIPGKHDIKEPIYAIFAMLEAVRLIEVPVVVPDNEANALVIGLGIGTTPAALMAHGIQTTIVEIDPVVHDYALKYFSLPPNHTPIIADAVSYAAKVAQNPEQRYDYVVHDVFTGGAEPVDLFTVEFMRDLHSTLKPNGVIAINYAGDLLLPSARLIVRTIKSVFPSCRIFRESPTPSEQTLVEDGQDFTNMVIFCLKNSPSSTNSTTDLVFRQPTEADFLKSGARQSYLMPKFEIQEDVFWAKDGDGEVLSRNDTARLEKWQRKSAVGHWNVMRTVLPDEIWENW